MTTTQKRNQMREDLARAMGWVLVNWSWVGNNRECQAAPPDPFTNAADNRALVAWLAADDDRWLPFKKELRLEWVASTSPRAASLDYERWMLTLPCEVIVIAAARALGIPEASE